MSADGKKMSEDNIGCDEEEEGVGHVNVTCRIWAP